MTERDKMIIAVRNAVQSVGIKPRTLLTDEEAAAAADAVLRLIEEPSEEIAQAGGERLLLWTGSRAERIAKAVWRGMIGEVRSALAFEHKRAA